MEKTYYKKAETAKFQTQGSFQFDMNNEFDKLRVYAEAEKPDWYGEGAIIKNFEKEMADFFYKEDAAFFISGTMAQQSMMRVYCDNAKIYKVAYHPTCHMEVHEMGGLREIHGIHSYHLGTRKTLFTLSDLKTLTDVSCVVFELPQREMGGAAPSLEELTEMVMYLKQRGIKCHLDGARILEVLPYYKYKTKELFTLFDSIYMSYYKGLGGMAGAILVGNKKDIDDARIWRKRCGGTLVHMYPYVLSAKQAFNENKDKMQEYWKFSLDYSELLSRIAGATIEPKTPVCNMFHIYFDIDKTSLMRALTKVIDAYDISLFNKAILDTPDGGSFTEVVLKDSYRHVPKLKLEGAVKLFDAELKKIRKNK